MTGGPLARSELSDPKKISPVIGRLYSAGDNRGRSLRIMGSIASAQKLLTRDARGSKGNDNRFTRRLVAAIGDVTQGNQWIGFGEIRRGAAARDVVSHHHKSPCVPFVTLETAH